MDLFCKNTVAKEKKSILPESGKVKVPSELEFVRKPPLSLSFPLGFEEIVMDRILPGISGFRKSMIFPYNFFLI